MKHIVLLLLLISMCFMLFACGSHTNNTQAGTEPNSYAVIGQGSSPSVSGEPDIMAQPSTTAAQADAAPYVINLLHFKNQSMYACTWNLEINELTERALIMEQIPNSSGPYWDGDRSIVLRSLGRQTDETYQVDLVRFNACCFRDYVVDQPDEALSVFTITHGNDRYDVDVSGLEIPGYAHDELMISGFVVDDGVLYLLICPRLLLDFRFYIVRLRLDDQTIEGVTDFAPPEDCSPAYPPKRHNILAVENEGFFIFGNSNVIRVDYRDGSVMPVFSERQLASLGQTDIQIEGIGLQNGYLVLNWMDGYYRTYISAFRDGKHVATHAVTDAYIAPNLQPEG